MLQTILLILPFFQVWYSFFVVAFALGFYIMLHKDYAKESDPNDDENPFFNQAGPDCLFYSTKES